jgi:hypothetical protein
VKVNAEATDGSAVDFSTLPGGVLDVSPSSVVLNYDRALVRAAGLLSVRVAGFAAINGNFGFQRHARRADRHRRSTRRCCQRDLLSFGAERMTGFVGLARAARTRSASRSR